MNAPTGRRWPHPLTWVAIVGYAALLPLPHGLPALGGSLLFLLYLLSLPVALLAFAIVGVRGALRLRAPDPAQRAAAQRGLAAAGIGIAAVVIAVLVSRALPDPLPSGSHLRTFDRAAWHAPDAAEFVKGDVTPRQKMLADIVEHVLPGSDRAAIEQALGPSDTADYFVDGGRDLLYRLGPQRDTPIGIDSEWLLIWLDPQGRFERYAIASD